MSSNINISQKNVAGQCTEKCTYSFKYGPSSSSLTNNGIMLSITYDAQSTPPVTFNDAKYTVDTVEIYAPSIHLFNDVVAPGEMCIVHRPVYGGNLLKVAIPLSSSQSTTRAGDDMTTMLNKAFSSAPTEGDTCVVSYNLQTMVPRRPFFSYTDNADNSNWIVYGIFDAIGVSSSVLDSLQQIIAPNDSLTNASSLFYNSTGPTSGVAVGDGLYISCQPTGSSKNNVPVDKSAWSTPKDKKSEDIALGFFIFITVVLLLCWGIRNTMEYMKENSASERDSLEFGHMYGEIQGADDDSDDGEEEGGGGILSAIGNVLWMPFSFVFSLGRGGDGNIGAE